MIMMVFLVGSMAIAAQAQNNGRPQLFAEVPFQFNVGNKTFPAGEYLVRSVSDDSSNVVLNIQSRDGETSTMLMMSTVEGNAQESAKLIFRRYGSQYFFAEAWVDGDAAGLRFPKSRAERTAEREIAGIKAKAEAVALTTRR